MRTLAIPKYLPLSLLLGILILAVIGLWRVQQKNVDSLDRQIDELQQQIDALPATVAPKDKLALGKDRLTLEKDRVNAQNAIYGTLVQALGGAFFFVTAYFSYRNVKATEANVKAAEEKQVTERFSKAIELLGSEKLEVRLGGIYALERIAKDSPKDRWTIMEVLSSFIQANSTLSLEEPPKITADVQAAVSVIRRRDLSKKLEEQKLDLSNANLCEADLSRTDLSGALLYRANLIGTRFNEANLRGATLLGAYFGKTLLSATSFSKTKGLDSAQVKEAEDWEEAIYDEDFRKKLGLPTESGDEKQNS